MSDGRRKKRSRKSSRSFSSSASNVPEADAPTSNIEAKYGVRSSHNLGRYMVSEVDIEPGEIILCELPIVVGPCTGTKVQCLGCYKNLECAPSHSRCLGCGWPLCSVTCPGLHQRLGHSELECSVLERSKSCSFFDIQDLTSVRGYLQAIVPLRCLLLKYCDHGAYASITAMEHHNAIRRNIPELWNANKKNVVDRIVKDWALVEFTADEVHTICGILEVNCFQIGEDDVNVRGLYPTAFLMSHDCVPNTHHVDDASYKLTVRASIRIPRGHPITMSYAYTLQNTLKRRQHLLENKFFECRCRRCCDPTELGSYNGALVCPKCEKGLVIAEQPLNPKSTWRCNDSPDFCSGYQVSARSIKLLLNRITQEVEDMDFDSVEVMENFLDRYRNVLHPTHYLCLGVKVALSQLYGKIDGYFLHQLTDGVLERKQHLCEEILRVCDVIEPGLSRIRGITMYEIHEPMLILLTRQLSDKSMSKSKIKSSLRAVVRYLTEASVILGYESDDSAEGLMARAAHAALVKIKEWEKIVGKI